MAADTCQCPFPDLGLKHVQRSINDNHVEVPIGFIVSEIGNHTFDAQSFRSGILKQLRNARLRNVDANDTVAQPRDESSVTTLTTAKIQNSCVILLILIEEIYKCLGGLSQRMPLLLVDPVIVRRHKDTPSAIGAGPHPDQTAACAQTTTARILHRSSLGAITNCHAIHRLVDHWHWVSRISGWHSSPILSSVFADR